MGILGDAIGRQRRGTREVSPFGEPVFGDPGAALGGAAAAEQPPREGGGAAGDAARSELGRRRDVLAEQVTELHWDLGGLAYEMAIRDHFRLDVLVARAAVLQERDAELAEVERLLALEEAAAAGTCPACSAPHSRGALYCWQCGATLMERTPSVAVTADPVTAGQTAAAPIDALLAGTRAANGPDAPPARADG
jgi:hypothetical protein